MGNERKRGNAKDAGAIYRVDVNRLIDGYEKMRTAMERIANPDPLKGPHQQALDAKRIAREALGL